MQGKHNHDDDITGESLGPNLVQVGCGKGMQRPKQMGAYKARPCKLLG